jgi:hypothetical protein
MEITRIVLLGDEESVLWYSELLLSVTVIVALVWLCGCSVEFFVRLRVDWHLCNRFDEPNNRRLCRRSRLRGVGNEALRRFDERGYKILSFGLPPHMTSARFVWMHWCVKSPSRIVAISPYRLWRASELLIKIVRDSCGDFESSKSSSSIDLWLRDVLDRLRRRLLWQTLDY